MAKKNVKEEILNLARRLFNQHGYTGVSMRDIADALDISVGNLTYHYKRKEDLLEAVVQEMHRYYSPPVVPATLPQLNAVLARMQNTIQEYAFFFWHPLPEGEVSPDMLAVRDEMAQDQYAMLAGAFAGFARAGQMRPEATRGEWQQLAQAVRCVCVYWQPMHLQEQHLPGAPADFLNCVWSVLLPCLTDAGRAVYQDKIVRVREEYERLLAATEPYRFDAQPGAPGPSGLRGK